MSDRITGNLVTLAGMMLWATSFPVTERLLETWHPLLLTPMRIGSAAAVLAVLVLATDGLTPFRGLPWRKILVVGGIGLGIANTFLILGLSYADPVTVAVIATMVPLVSVIMGVLGGRERLTWPVALGIALAIGGGVLVSVKPDAPGPGFRGGELLVVCSIVAWTWFSRVSVQHFAAIPDRTKAASTMFGGTLASGLVATIAVAAGLITPRWEISQDTLPLLAWMGPIAISISMVLWLRGSRLLGVTIAGIHQNMVPFYVILLSLALGGGLILSQLWGAIMVAAGAILAQQTWLTRKSLETGVR